MPQPIVSADDLALHDYVGLTDVALRRRVEPERGLYIAESEKVIRRALAAGHRPRSFLMAERWLTDLADVVERAEADGIPVYVGDHEVIESLTGFHLHRGALAAMHRPVLPSVGDLVAKASRVISRHLSNCVDSWAQVKPSVPTHPVPSSHCRARLNISAMNSKQASSSRSAIPMQSMVFSRTC